MYEFQVVLSSSLFSFFHNTPWNYLTSIFIDEAETKLVVLAAQLYCWTGQFIVHGVFEKRAPALLDNLTQAFLMAPFFVLLEVFQSLFGYKPYPGFHTRVKAKIGAEIKEWQDKKGKKLS
ncbi:hypothetical protein K1719_031500 [Acacia pycnantha]|nr:hypothetical protein K1719_031500 [Acacia pycnantha]